MQPLEPYTLVSFIMVVVFMASFAGFVLLLALEGIRVIVGKQEPSEELNEATAEWDIHTHSYVSRPPYFF